MVSVYTLSQTSWPMVATYNQCSIGSPMVHAGNICTIDRFQLREPESKDSELPRHRQWPWRIFAFCSDLGTVGCLTNKPKLGLIGWALALPYYAYALISQPNNKKRKEELAYQATANGILPFIEAKAGVQMGGLCHQYLNKQLLQKHSIPILNKLTQPMAKIGGGVTALLALTPTIGDPLSQWLVKCYNNHVEKDD